METVYYKKALLLVWVFISIPTLFTLISPFLLSEDTIYKITPKCEWKAKYNKECILCGMTSAFIDISKGKFADASSRNRGSIYLFAIFLSNNIFLCVCFLNPRLRILLKK